MVLICISLLISNVEHLFLYLLTYLEKCLFRSSTHFFIKFRSVQSLSHVQLFETPWNSACQASLSITNSQSLVKLMSIKSVMWSKNLILCRPLLLPSVLPRIRLFSSESALCIRWPKYSSFSFSISPSNECSGLISFRIDWLDLLVVDLLVRDS